MESLLPRSMYQSDFQPYNLQTKQATQSETVQPKHEDRSKYRPIQMDLEILQPFKLNLKVPFSLWHQKKSILQTNPHDPIPEQKLEDKMFDRKLEARRKRSAVYMTPQINFDQIPEDVMYGKEGNTGLSSSIYSSDWKKAFEVVINNSPFKIRDDPKKSTFTKIDLIDKSIERTRFQPENIIPPMEIGLGKFVPNWDKLNPKEFVDTTKLFWDKNKEIGLCSLCNPQNLSEDQNDKDKTELDSCLNEDALRTPFTLHPPGYTGYVPRLAPGIQFRRKQFTKYDPFVTTLMISQGAYDKNWI